MPRAISRREALGRCAAGMAADALGTCRGAEVIRPAGPARLGTLLSRPAPPTLAVTPGLQPLGLATGRDGVLYVPAGYDAAVPAPLLLLLHGAGGAGDSIAEGFAPLADATGVVLLAPDSRARTWDRIRGGFGPDVAFIDGALAHAFARCNADPARVATGGFSDGASYALALGLTNGDLFSRLLALSPGFAPADTRRGTPRIFVTHGVQDTVLPIDQCSRRIVPALRALGYEVRYEEFDGGHAIPRELATTAMEWLRTA